MLLSFILEYGEIRLSSRNLLLNLIQAALSAGKHMRACKNWFCSVPLIGWECEARFEVANPKVWQLFKPQHFQNFLQRFIEDRSNLFCHYKEAHREEMLVNRLMRQSQQERRIAVQLMQVSNFKLLICANVQTVFLPGKNCVKRTSLKQCFSNLLFCQVWKTVPKWFGLRLFEAQLTPLR